MRLGFLSELLHFFKLPRVFQNLKFFSSRIVGMKKLQVAHKGCNVISFFSKILSFLDSSLGILLVNICAKYEILFIAEVAM